MTEASQCICTLICPFTGPTTNHCQGNRLGHLRIVEYPNVHIISLQLLIHYTCEHWPIATEPYDRIPTVPRYRYKNVLLSQLGGTISSYNHALFISHERLVVFYGISTHVGYLISNPVYTYDL